MTEITDTEDASGREDRARAFVPELLPEPQDIERTGPLTPKEEQTLGRVHAARDHHQAAKWIRGKALAVAFSRRLYRGQVGTRTRQEYLDDEWDGISESAAYLEIKEWPLAAQITKTLKRPAPDSHVRALVDVAELRGAEPVARWYGELRTRGQEIGRRVTADVVANLAEFLRSGEDPASLEALFTPRQIAPPKPRKAPKASPIPSPKPEDEGTGGTPFQNFGMGSGPGGGWALSADHVGRLSAWIAAEAAKAEISPDRAADLLLDALGHEDFQQWIAARAQG
ncbi:hypothetical protein ACWDMY_20295 [Streptomyces globisporus]|uniref:hypothetical protein n=1 Tax=Streptomyces globisporus TaxID=1908 RepID=UPI002F90DC31|nr:hypothetical protein OG215_42170 [Streptomyces globisporus]